MAGISEPEVEFMVEFVAGVPTMLVVWLYSKNSLIVALALSALTCRIKGESKSNKKNDKTEIMRISNYSRFLE